MKSKVWLNMLLIMSIVLQSFIAVSAQTESHELDVEHLQVVHDHASDNNSHAGTEADDDHDINDCHHCGHCSGSHISWILVKSFAANLAGLHQHGFLTAFAVPDDIANGIYRPPIA